MTTTYSEMNAAAALTGAEIVPIVQSGANARTTVDALKSFVASSVTQVLTPPLNLAISIASAAATATITADQLTLGTSLSGNSVVLANFSESINLGVVGAGGMDTGTATAPGFIAVYAIYNPTTADITTLATLESSSAAPEIYGGTHPVSGYTFSRLLTVWPLATTGNFAIGYQQDRTVFIGEVAVTTGVAVVGYTSVSLATQIPKKAKTFSGGISLAYAGGSPTAIYKLSPKGSTTGNQQFALFTSTAVAIQTRMVVSNMPVVETQVVYYSITGQAFSTADLSISSYTF